MILKQVIPLQPLSDKSPFFRDRQVGKLSVVSYCSELASGELQDLEFSKSCRKILNFASLASKILNILNFAGKISIF